MSFMSTRRRFLRDSSLFAVAAALVPAGGLAAPVGGGVTSLDQLHFGAFAANVGSTFWVLQDQGPATGLLLAQAMPSPPPANALQAAAPDARNEKFSLLFHGLTGQPLAQDTYLFDQAALGRFAMFIVPIGCRNAGYLLYEAVFNRPVGRIAPGGWTGGRPAGGTSSLKVKN
jgi:hypothetical protein